MADKVVQPILVCMVWRGGDRFIRCVASIEESARHFSRVVISVTGPQDGADMEIARAAQARHPRFEVICTGSELPTMQHQSFWVDYLLKSGAGSDDWVCWLAYDDELRPSGLHSLVDGQGSWPLQPGTAYFGPWAMRGEDPDLLWNGDPADPLEVWTSFPQAGPTRLPVERWIGDQLHQPTYMQMSGSVNQLSAFVDLKESRPLKRGPMRIEMAVAASPGTSTVEEFDEPITIIYGRSDSDRASYGKAARREDLHLVARLLRYGARHPVALPQLTWSVVNGAMRSVGHGLGLVASPGEDWRVRTVLSD